MQTIGEKLEEARKRRGISLREASEITKIRSEYLGNFESSVFDLNIPEVYIRGFLRSYANFLKLNADKIITDYNAHRLGESKVARTESREFLGRMDIPTEESSEGPPPGSVPPHRLTPAATTTDSDLEYNNFDKSALLRGGAYVGGASVVVVLVVLLVLAVLRSGPDDLAAAQDSPGNVATQNNQELFLIASGGDVTNITVTELSTGLELFRGPLTNGDRLRVPFDQQVRLSYTHAQHLRIEHNNQQFQMQGRNVGRSTYPPNAAP